MPDPQRILVVHGPNLNLLGTREPEVYGAVTLEEIDAALRDQATAVGAELEICQSNQLGTSKVGLGGLGVKAKKLMVSSNC